MFRYAVRSVLFPSTGSQCQTASKTERFGSKITLRHRCPRKPRIRKASPEQLELSTEPTVTLFDRSNTYLLRIFSVSAKNRWKTLQSHLGTKSSAASFNIFKIMKSKASFQSCRAWIIIFYILTLNQPTSSYLLHHQ